MIAKKHGRCLYYATSFIALICASTLFAQEAEEDRPEFTLKERMAEMASLVDDVQINVLTGNEIYEAKRKPKALLRTIEVARRDAGNEDGSLWIWSHDGLPVAFVELFARNNSHNWGHTLLAVSSQKIEGGAGDNKWLPKSGVEFKPVPETKKPNQSKALRKAQMRKISRRFATNIEDPAADNRQQFRLLTEPLHRYQGRDVQDGAVFAFVRGQSNPEVLLFVQSRNEKWEYGFLRCSSNELVAQLDDTEVWRAPQVPGWVGGPDKPFWVVYRRYAVSTEPDEQLVQ